MKGLWHAPDEPARAADEDPAAAAGLPPAAAAWPPEAAPAKGLLACMRVPLRWSAALAARGRPCAAERWIWTKGVVGSCAMALTGLADAPAPAMVRPPLAALDRGVAGEPRARCMPARPAPVSRAPGPLPTADLSALAGLLLLVVFTAAAAAACWLLPPPPLLLGTCIAGLAPEGVGVGTPPAGAPTPSAAAS